ncbi:helix-turn-helix transcriptional regulator [Pleionea sp. CnH1-48]|uniref:helix-turn-helix domain-containing protein n=1 Tax=Pleionea sp. CnH1-48 TaxID=2954494 RepID=UPI002096B510|nr:helix-turn-helix transcriptional regulator [Pleionea sp. CnH1-48]MCO7223876.1 helix-turn-helix transcriptional regulator [Pleionea sp. CnH1-48]
MLNIEAFIRDLYLQSSCLNVAEFRPWVLTALRQVMRFDAAFWGTGHFKNKEFHYSEHYGLDEHFYRRFGDTLELNPVKDRALANLDRPVIMSKVIPDQEFFQSSLYKQLYQPYGISRVLSTLHRETESGLYTLFSLYRFALDDDFNEAERTTMNRLTYHLMAASSHNYFLHLGTIKSCCAAAICDSKGYYLETQAGFFDYLRASGVSNEEQRLTLPLEEKTFYLMADWKLVIKPLGSLFQVMICSASPLDQLTSRESQIVDWIVRGLTFKEVAKELCVAPSTISNHLYRIYKKLNISSRGELARLHLNRSETEPVD